ncbi:MAG: hypothetical protein P8L79_06070 [Rhodospirillaceae bacterium]|nr:hypothetical protein [Rhodospirillaceae bacterium]
MTENNSIAVEDVIDFVPASNQFHVNILFTADTNDIADYYAVLGQGINNLQLNAFTNMSLSCRIND